jgi:hypothetical protein
MCQPRNRDFPSGLLSRKIEALKALAGNEVSTIADLSKKRERKLDSSAAGWGYWDPT